MISVELSKRFKKMVRAAGREAEVSATLKSVLDGFGQPHAHTGLAIRKLGKHLYECRTGLAWRLIFEAHKGVLTFDFAGDHDEVQNYLRGKRQIELIRLRRGFDATSPPSQRLPSPTHFDATGQISARQGVEG